MKITLLHGALGSGDQLLPLSQALKEKGFSTEILELPGHGKSSNGISDFTIEGFSQWLKETMDKKNLWKDPFFGFSMGGYIMLYLLSHRPNADTPVITLGTKFYWNSEEAQKEVSRLNIDKIIEKVPKFAQLLDERHKDWKYVVSSTRKLMLNLGEKPLLNEISVSGILNRIRILRGGSDQMVTLEESKTMAACFPNGSFKEMNGVPHPLEQVNPNDIADEIKKFLHNTI